MNKIKSIFSMEKLKSFLTANKRKITIIASIAAVIIVIVGFVAIRGVRALQAQVEDLQTVKAEVGSLTATVGATGTVRPNQTAQLAWRISGTVEEVNYQVGDQVRKGAVLASLEMTSLPQNVILAQADLVNAQNALDDLSEKHELNLAEAQQAVADARDAIRDAEIRLNSYRYPADQQEIKSAYARVVLAEDQLKKAKSVYNRFKNNAVDNLKRASAQVALDAAQDAYDAALREYNYMNGNVNEITISQAEAGLLVAQEKLLEAEAEYEELIDGPNSDDVAIAEAQVAAAQANLNQAWIESPFAGIVTQAEPLSGDQVSAGALAFRLDDTSSLLVDVEISEVDINRVAVGQSATLTFDAILATEYQGVVVEVAPVGVANQGIVNFKVTVKLTDPDERVKPGMTAAANIVVTELEEVLLVPNRAVRVVDGNRVVYILKNSMLTPLEVELGASSDMYSEVTGGELNAGDNIVLNPPAVFQPMGGPPGGMGGN